MPSRSWGKWSWSFLMGDKTAIEWNEFPSTSLRTGPEVRA